MRVRDVMSSPVATVTTGTTVKRAAELLAGNGFTALPVLDEDDRLIGIVTEADLVHDRFPRDPRYRSAHPDYHSASAPVMATVGDVMTLTVITTGPGTDVVDLVTVMLDDRVRSVPIVDGSTSSTGCPVSARTWPPSDRRWWTPANDTTTGSANTARTCPRYATGCGPANRCSGGKNFLPLRLGVWSPAAGSLALLAQVFLCPQGDS